MGLEADMVEVKLDKNGTPESVGEVPEPFFDAGCWSYMTEDNKHWIMYSFNRECWVRFRRVHGLDALHKDHEDKSGRCWKKVCDYSKDSLSYAFNEILRYHYPKNS